MSDLVERKALVRAAATVAVCVPVLLWGWYVFLQYYATHPSVLAVFHAPIDGVLSLLAAAVVFLSSASLGAGMLALLGAIEDLALRLLTSVALGSGALAILVFAAGFFGLAKPIVIVVVLLGSFGWGLRRIVADLVALASTLGRATIPVSTVLLSAALAALGLAMLVSALAPPNGWDELSYHIPLAVEGAQTGGFPLYAHNCSFLPELCEVLTCIGIVIGGPPGVGRVLHYGFGALLLTAVFTASRDLAPGVRWARWLSVGILVVEPVVNDIARVAGVDLTMSFFAVVAVMNLLRADQDWRPTLVAGILGGYACGTTYRGIHTAVALTVCTLVVGRVRSFWALAAGGTIAGCPWYLRNLILSGNPVYPFAANVFPERRTVPTGFTALGWPDPRVELRQFATGGYGTKLPLSDWLRLPWDATIEGRRWTGGKFDTDISPFYLASLPSLALVKPSALRRPDVVWCVFAVVHSVAWAFGVWCTRYDLPAFAAFATVFPSLVLALRFPAARAAVAFSSWVGVGALYACTLCKTDLRADARVVFGMEDMWHYLATHEDGPLFAYVKALNETEGDKSPVLMLGEKRILYLERPVIPDFNLDNVGALYRNGGKTPEGMRDLLVRSGVHDLLEHQYESRRALTPEEIAAYNTFRERYTKVVAGAGTYLLWLRVQ
jgi:hypothetical protein